MSAWSLVGLLIAVRVGAAAARSTTMARRVDAVDEVPNFMKKARPALTRRRLDVGSYSYSYAYDDDFASDSSSSDCVNDDYSTDEYEDSCSEWYDDNPGGCGGYDDSNFASNVQCCACGGGTRCDIVVSGSSLPELHGTYEQKGSCNGYPRWKCDEDGGCDQDQYIWYYSDYSNWHIGPDSCSGSAAIYISDPSADPDEDLAAVSGTWSEWTGSEWQTNSGISVTCAGAYYSYSYSGACTENCIACDGPGYEDCLECESGYAHYDADGDGGGSCAPTTAAPSAAPTSPAPTTAAPTTATPSTAPTVTFEPTKQPTDKPTWELHASRGWRSGVLDILAKDEMHIAYTSNPMQSSAQCLHGNEMYLPARVLCDRQCMLDGAAVAKASGGTRAPPTPEECAGPWYCARTDVCELFRNPEHAPGSDAGFDRRCTTIWGCANHSMCFPTEDAAAGMHIDFRKEDLAIKRRSGDRPGHQARWVSDPMELRYGGFTVRTTCCANDHDFAVGVDMPCNGAARATALVGFGLLLWGLFS